jgi:catechol 2,3-dioxygenase-like lactoylglutathione lyase family enzyme
MAITLNHVNILATNLEETIAFYVRAIGLTEGWRPPFGFAGAWLYAGEIPVVHLTLAGPGAASGGASVSHIAFAFDDLDAAQKRLDQLGLRYSPPTRQPGTGLRQIFLADPNGVAVELQGR